MTFPKPTVLVVDDDRTNRMILAGVLKDECSVILAKDGASALRLTRENDDICLVLLDVTMPDMDGYEVLRNLKADQRTADIPVVFITGNTEEKEEEYGLLLGAADYVFKPIRPAIVRARIRNLLKMAVLGRELNHSSDRDTQTGLFSRSYFDEAFATLCALAVKTEEPLGLALVEIDNFGHLTVPAGTDQTAILCGIARCVKKQAIRPCEIAARYNETTFILLLPRAAEMDQTLKSLQEAVQALENAADESNVPPSVSIGAITMCGANGLVPDVLLNRAKALLSEVKAQGGNSLKLSSISGTERIS